VAVPRGEIIDCDEGCQLAERERRIRRREAKVRAIVSIDRASTDSGETRISVAADRLKTGAPGAVNSEKLTGITPRLAGKLLDPSELIG